MRDYISLHAHSEFSNVKIIDSINRYDRSIDYCWDLGLGGVAMTEHDCVSGAIKYIKAFKKKFGCSPATYRSSQSTAPDKSGKGEIQ